MFLAGGPPVPAVVLPTPDDGDFRSASVLIQLEGDDTPQVAYYKDLIPATLTHGRRVFRHAGGAPRFGTVIEHGNIARRLVLGRMTAEEPSVIVQWDNKESEVVVKTNLTPIVFSDQ